MPKIQVSPSLILKGVVFTQQLGYVQLHSISVCALTIKGQKAVDRPIGTHISKSHYTCYLNVDCSGSHHTSLDDLLKYLYAVIAERNQCLPES